MDTSYIYAKYAHKIRNKLFNSNAKLNHYASKINLLMSNFHLLYKKFKKLKKKNLWDHSQALARRDGG